MSERGIVNVTSQLGVETVLGTPVAANRILRSLSFMPTFERETSFFTPRGHRYPTAQLIQKEHGVGTYEGIMCYNSLLYVLCSVFAAPSPAAIGAATLAKKWSGTASTSGNEAGKSYTFETGDATAVDKYPAGLLTTLTLGLDQSEAKVNGDLITRKPTFNASQTATPTSIVARPVMRSHLAFYLDPTLGAIGTTKVAAMRETVSIGTKKHAVWVHDPALSSWEDVVDVPVDFTWSFIMPHNSQSRSYLDSVIAGPGMQYFRVQATGAQIDTDTATPVYESIKLDIAGKFDKPKPTDEEDVYAYEYTFRAMHDDTMGAAFKWEIINLLTTL